MVDWRFRQANDYGWAHGFLSGFPNFHEANYGQGVVYGTFLVKGGTAEWRDVPASQLGNPNLSDVGARFRATNDWARRNGFFGGFPNFHHANYGQGVVCGTILFKHGSAEWRDVPARELGNPNPGDVGARFRATNDYAVRNGFLAGFPNFHQADYGRGVVYGTILLRHGTAEWRDVFADVLGIFGRFTFDAGITVEQRRRLLERHSFARSRAVACGNLNSQERSNLISAYRRSIRHSVSNDPNANASAIVGGSQIWVNFNNLFPQGNNEIAQTLIHEMMHCASYTHPNRRDTPPPPGRAWGQRSVLWYSPAPVRALHRRHPEPRPVARRGSLRRERRAVHHKGGRSIAPRREWVRRRRTSTTEKDRSFTLE